MKKRNENVLKVKKIWKKPYLLILKFENTNYNENPNGEDLSAGFGS